MVEVKDVLTATELLVSRTGLWYNRQDLVIQLSKVTTVPVAQALAFVASERKYGREKHSPEWFSFFTIQEADKALGNFPEETLVSALADAIEKQAENDVVQGLVSTLMDKRSKEVVRYLPACLERGCEHITSRVINGASLIESESAEAFVLGTLQDTRYRLLALRAIREQGAGERFLLKREIIEQCVTWGWDESQDQTLRLAALTIVEESAQTLVRKARYGYR